MDVPADYLDASELRQIPDNQEVFLRHASETSMVVEILAMVEEGPAATDLWEAVKYHFSSLSQDNASLSTTILTPSPGSPIPSQPQPSRSPTTPRPVILKGTQAIHKYSRDPTGAPRPGHESDVPDEVWIALALWRIWIQPEGPGGKKKADVVCSVNVNLSAENGRGLVERDAVEAWWETAVQNMQVLDWGLFGDVE